jgi:hypothetical protein
LSEAEFEYGWPPDVQVVDRRDQMHFRGWTYFRIDGQIGGRKISGRGRVPFVYDAFHQNLPWLVVDVGDELRITDSGQGASLSKPGGALIARYPSGSFFKGLARPWMGMHTLDIVRRDAAARRIWFDTAPAGNENHLIVTLQDQRDQGDTHLVYKIDLENDLLKVIKFRLGRRDAGSLAFTYLQEVEQAEGDFAEPDLPDAAGADLREEPGLLWLIDLARGRLG